MGRVLLVAALIAVPSVAGATYSVVAVDLRTGQIVFALATCATGPPPSASPPPTSAPRRNLTSVIVPGKGVATCQAAVDLTGETQVFVLEQIQKGAAPQEIIRLLHRDPRVDTRQFGIVDLRGRAAGFTGRSNQPVALDLHGRVGEILFSIQGNILARREVVTAAVCAFRTASGSLSDRAMAAMEAADAQGGDRRCTCDTEPRPPAPCRSKTALTARLTLAERTDPIGEYRLDLSVSSATIEPNEDANPVATLRLRYDTWKRANPH